MDQDRHNTIFYLPHGPVAYPGAFPLTPAKERRIGAHSVAESERGTVISPDDLSRDTLQPQNFIDLQKAEDIEEIWLIDFITGEGPLVHIIDHRNMTGINPLAGKTPIGCHPRFPDMGTIYSTRNRNLPRCVVETVGPERFRGEVNPCASEIAALVALCAAYAGMKVMALGWSRDKDPHGEHLSRFVSNL